MFNAKSSIPNLHERIKTLECVVEQIAVEARIGRELKEKHPAVVNITYKAWWSSQSVLWENEGMDWTYVNY